MNCANSCRRNDFQSRSVFISNKAKKQSVHSLWRAVAWRWIVSIVSEEQRICLTDCARKPSKTIYTTGSSSPEWRLSWPVQTLGLHRERHAFNSWETRVVASEYRNGNESAFEWTFDFSCASASLSNQVCSSVGTMTLAKTTRLEIYGRKRGIKTWHKCKKKLRKSLRVRYHSYAISNDFE